MPQFYVVDAAVGEKVKILARCIRDLLSPRFECASVRGVNHGIRTPVMSITDLGWLVGDLSSIMEWKLIDTVPLDRDLELAVIDSRGAHRIAFPCRRLPENGWLDVETNNRVYDIRPTHWRDWSSD